MHITSDDLTWWEGLASGLPWIWAKTYATSAPHHYIVEGRTPGLEHRDFVRAARVIHTFGQPAKFYSSTNLYLTSADGSVRWWTMDQDVRGTNLVNQAVAGRHYGVQNAPVTRSRYTTEYDAVATVYDEQRPAAPGLGQALAEVVSSLGLLRPSVLDVGAGTGLLLDLGITPPHRCAAVDPSGPMLNQLVRKHPSIGSVHPERIEVLLRDGAFTVGQFELVTVLDVALSSRMVERLRQIASVAVIVGDGARMEVLPSYLPRLVEEWPSARVTGGLRSSVPS